MARAGRCGYGNIICKLDVHIQQTWRGSDVVKVMWKNADAMQARIRKLRRLEEQQQLTRASIVVAMLGDYNSQSPKANATASGSWCNDAEEVLWFAKIASQKSIGCRDGVEDFWDKENKSALPDLAEYLTSTARRDHGSPMGEVAEGCEEDDVGSCGVGSGRRRQD